MAATDQASCDVIFYGRFFYDLKMGKNGQFTKNLLKDFSYDELTNGNIIGKYFKYTLQGLQMQENNSLRESVYIQTLNTKLKDLIIEYNKSLDNPIKKIQLLQEWNYVLFTTIHKRPTTVKIPIIIPRTTEPFIPQIQKELLDNFNLPLGKSLDAKAVKDSAENYMKSWDRETLKNTFNETNGAIGKLPDEID